MVVVGAQAQGNALDAGTGAVLDRERESVTVAAQVKQRVAPCVKLGAPAKRLSGARLATSLLGVVDDKNRGSVTALYEAQLFQEDRDLTT